MHARRVKVLRSVFPLDSVIWREVCVVPAHGPLNDQRDNLMPLESEEGIWGNQAVEIISKPSPDSEQKKKDVLLPLSFQQLCP